MAKYLLQVSYTTEGLKGLLKEGGSSRAETIKRVTQGLGGSVEAFYFAFGENDVLVARRSVCDGPLGRRIDLVRGGAARPW